MEYAPLPVAGGNWKAGDNRKNAGDEMARGLSVHGLRSHAY